jgi:hypothetical protein
MDDARIIRQLERLGDTNPADIPDALSQIAEGLLLILERQSTQPRKP